MTLIELLVALVTMGILLSLVYSSLQNGNILVNKVLSRADSAEQYHAAVRLLRRQIEHAALVETRDNRSRRMLRFRGLSNSLTLVAPLPLYSNNDALYEMRFYLSNNSLFLSFFADGDNEENAELIELLSGVEYLDIEYLNSDMQWLSHWLHQRQLPVAVRVNMRRDSEQAAQSLHLPLQASSGSRV